MLVEMNGKNYRRHKDDIKVVQGQPKTDPKPERGEEQVLRTWQQQLERLAVSNVQEEGGYIPSVWGEYGVQPTGSTNAGIQATAATHSDPGTRSETMQEQSQQMQDSEEALEEIGASPSEIHQRGRPVGRPRGSRKRTGFRGYSARGGRGGDNN